MVKSIECDSICTIADSVNVDLKSPRKPLKFKLLILIKEAVLFGQPLSIHFRGYVRTQPGQVDLQVISH